MLARQLLRSAVLVSSAPCVRQRVSQAAPRALSFSRHQMRASSTAAAAASDSSSAVTGLAVAEAKEALRKASVVCFDVDSTVINEEGIDALADHCGAGPAVAEWTARAMGGDVPFQDALAARLELIKPSRADIADCLRVHPPALTDGVADVIAALQARGTEVWLVSGGFRLMIEPVADLLDIPHERIMANTIEFDDSAEGGGAYAGFDESEPTSRSGGKPAVMARLKEGFKGGRAHDVIVMVGDGNTDLEAKPPATAFIGFGGIAERPKVRDNADWFVRDFADVLAVLREE